MIVSDQEGFMLKHNRFLLFTLCCLLFFAARLQAQPAAAAASPIQNEAQALVDSLSGSDVISAKIAGGILNVELTNRPGMIRTVRDINRILRNESYDLRTSEVDGKVTLELEHFNRGTLEIVWKKPLPSGNGELDSLARKFSASESEEPVPEAAPDVPSPNESAPTAASGPGESVNPTPEIDPLTTEKFPLPADEVQALADSLSASESLSAKTAGSILNVELANRPRAFSTVRDINSVFRNTNYDLHTSVADGRVTLELEHFNRGTFETVWKKTVPTGNSDLDRLARKFAADEGLVEPAPELSPDSPLGLGDDIPLLEQPLPDVGPPNAGPGLEAPNVAAGEAEIPGFGDQTAAGAESALGDGAIDDPFGEDLESKPVD